MSVYITRINGLSFTDSVQYKQHVIAGIAHRLGVKEMGIYRYDADSECAENLHARVDGMIAGINRGDPVICQFPTGNGLKFEWTLINHLKAYGGRVAIFLQDLEPLHYEEKQFMLREVINLYNQAEILIVPSLAMRQFLLDNRIRKDMKFVIQEIWDCTLNFSFLPNEIFAESLREGFGVVWYRNVWERQYMEYSAFFLMSRFLAAGIPVIVPTGMAGQKIIEDNHLGIITDSLDEAEEKLKIMSEEEHQRYVQSVEMFAPALRNGYYTESCLLEAMQLFYRKDTGKLAIPKKLYGMEDCTFTFSVLRESYGGKAAFSWIYRGDTDGFLIYENTGALVYTTKNIHRHYCLIDGYDREKGFIVKAYVDTLKGKLVIAESRCTYLEEERYEKPTVSLVIPAYNAQDYISRSIDTALAQSFSDLEIIIVDDGSSDETMEILNWYAENYPNVAVIHQENAGTPAARNTGIMAAGGEYIGFMDNDDMIHPDMIKRLYESAKKNDCDIAVTSVYQITDNGYEAFIQYPMEEDTGITMDEFFHMHFTTGCMFAVVLWNKLYRASLVKQRLIPVLIADDNAWTPYILSYGEKICYLNTCFYEWDRKIRSSTLVDQWQRRSNEELFQTYKDTILFYLEQGNPKRRSFLKKLAERQLSELERAYPYEEYKKLLNQIQAF